MPRVANRIISNQARGLIRGGNPNAGLKRGMSAVIVLFQQGDRIKAKQELSILEGYLTAGGYLDHVANAYDMLEQLCNEVESQKEADIARSKAFNFREQSASNKGIDNLVQFYTSQGLDGSLVELLSKDRTSIMEEKALEERQKGESELFEKVWNAYYLAGNYLSKKHPGIAGQLRWTMGMMAEKLNDNKTALWFYENAMPLLKKDKEINHEIYDYQLKAGLTAIEARDQKKAEKLLCDWLENLKNKEGKYSARERAKELAYSLVDKYGPDVEGRYASVINNVLKPILPEHIRIPLFDSPSR